MYVAARCLMLLICEMKFDPRKMPVLHTVSAINDAVRTAHKYAEEPISITKTGPCR